MTPADQKLCSDAGWDVECESPLKFRHAETGSFASGLAAICVLAYAREEAEEAAEAASSDSTAVRSSASDEFFALVGTVNRGIRHASQVDTYGVWKETFDLVFSAKVSHRIGDLLQELGIRLEYNDPDTGYKEDVVAYSVALDERAKSLRNFYPEVAPA